MKNNMMSSPDNEERYNSLFKIGSTSAACLIAGVITYPAESYRIGWEQSTLKFWNPELEHVVVDRKQFRVMAPLIRLTLKEGSSNLLNTILTTIPSINSISSHTHDIERECLAGAIAGISQAFLLSPLEAWRANQVMKKERMLSDKWQYWLYSQVMKGGTINPEERRYRAFQGVGLTAVREGVASTKQGEDIISLAASGIVAGSICSLAVTPLDVSKSYMMNSRERWSLWSGKKIHSVPVRLLARGLVLQSFCIGPAFGLVAATYEWCG